MNFSALRASPQGRALRMGFGIIALFAIFRPLPACADRKPAPPSTTTCRIMAQDPFEPDARIGSGPHAGECVDTTNYRSFRLLENSDVANLPGAIATLDPTKYRFIANVQHFGKFWVAAIPSGDLVSRMIFQAEHFPPNWLAAHTQTRVDFKPGMEPLLFLQTDFMAPPVKMSSLVLSNEAVPFRGGPAFNLITGIGGSFAFGKRLVSLPDEVEKIRTAKHWTEQYELRFGTDERQNRFWNFALQVFNDPEMKQVYDTLEHNCSNSIYEAVDLFEGRSRGTWDRAETTMPLFFGYSLRSRALIDDHSELKSLNEEFNIPY